MANISSINGNPIVLDEVSNLENAFSQSIVYLNDSSAVSANVGQYMIYQEQFVTSSSPELKGAYFKVSAGSVYLIHRSVSGIIAYGYNQHEPFTGYSQMLTEYTRKEKTDNVVYKANANGYLCVFFGRPSDNTTFSFYRIKTVSDVVEDSQGKGELPHFEVGAIDGETGRDVNNNARARSNYIKCASGDTIFSFGKFYFVAYYYDQDKTYTGNSYAESGYRFVIKKELQHDGYVRIVTFKSDQSEITYSDLQEIGWNFAASSKDISLIMSRETDTRSKTDKVKFEIGMLQNENHGIESSSTTRARSQYLKGTEGDRIRVYGGYSFLIFYYDDNYEYVGYSYTEDTAWIKDKYLTRSGYFRVLMRKNDNNDTILSDDLAGFESSVYITSVVSTDLNFEEYKINSFIKVRTLDGFSDYKKQIGDSEALAQSYLVRGKIVKSGNQILGNDGNVITLTGIGTHSISEYNSLYTANVMKTLLYNGLNCIRISVYLNDNRFSKSDGRQSLGWIQHSDTLRPIIENLVEVATDEGLYVILDWHSYHTTDGDATTYTSQQEDFFRYFSSKYNTYTNILYELHNEPYRNTAAELLPSVTSCSNIIRANVPDAILICGCGSDGALAMNTLFNTTNNLDIFISPHLYTGEQPITEVTDLIDAGLPIFVSEWGNSSLSGDDSPRDDRANDFFSYLHAHNVSYCLWKMTYQDMDTSILRYDPFMSEWSYQYGGWQKSDLSHNGKLYFNNIQQYRFNKQMH